MTPSTATDDHANEYAEKRFSDCRCLAILPMSESI